MCLIMNRQQLQAFYDQVNEATLAADTALLRQLFHPDFVGVDSGVEYDFSHIIERTQHTKARYGCYFFKLIDCQSLGPDQALMLTYFYGHDQQLDKACERHFAVHLTFKEGKIISEAILCNPPFEPGFNSLNTHVTIEALQRQKLYQILKMANFHHLSLTSRELDCLFHYLIGKTYRETGEALHISGKTVDSHLTNVKSKCGIESLKELKSFFKLQ